MTDRQATAGVPQELEGEEAQEICLTHGTREIQDLEMIGQTTTGLETEKGGLMTSTILAGAAMTTTTGGHSGRKETVAIAVQRDLRCRIFTTT